MSDFEFIANKPQDKKTRMQVIRMIVGNNPISSQEELARELEKAGFPSTQTTLSRDLKQLRISKVRTRSGKSVYALPRDAQYTPVPTREEVNETKWGLHFSNNIAVIHTPPGHASLVAYDIDAIKSHMLLGSVAGDDTVIVVMSEEADRDIVKNLLKEAIPQLNRKYIK